MSTKQKPEGAISSESKEVCECCEKLKPCHMFLTQMGTAAWVCESCRNGTTEMDE